MELRPYQTQSVNEARASFSENHKCIILTIPTGGGKTVIFSYIVQNALKKGNRAMILCDRKELIKQAHKNIAQYGLSPTIIAPGHRQLLNNLYLASVDSLRRREFPEIDILIVDEAHKQTFDPIIKKYMEINPTLTVIGATATPLRTGNQSALSDIYTDMVGESVSISYLIQSGFLVKEKTFAAKKDFSDVGLLGGDYESKALFKKFNEAKLYADVVGKYHRIAPGTKAICFNVNVQHSVNMCQAFNAAGISAKHLEAGSPDRAQVLEEFSRGDFQVLCNCSILTTGYDESSIQTVILNRATKSQALYLQMTGRGGRIHPGKEFFTIIDMGSNVYEHGMWSDERVWSLTKKKKSEVTGAPAKKMCPACEYINPVSVRACQECHHEFPIKKKELLDAEFEEVKSVQKKVNTRGMSLAQLHAVAKERGYASGWAFKMNAINTGARIASQIKSE